MKLHQLTKITDRPKKRLGRGLGSGKGRTSGRGSKGQKARENVPVGFIGGTLPLYKKLPYKRGIGNPKRSSKMIPLSLSKLASLPANFVVNLESLIEKGLVPAKDAQKYGVKIVAGGEVKNSLTIELPISESASALIEKAGGKITHG